MLSLHFILTGVVRRGQKNVPADREKRSAIRQRVKCSDAILYVSILCQHCAHGLVRLRDQNHVVRVRKRSYYGLKYLVLLPQRQLENVPTVAKVSFVGWKWQQTVLCHSLTVIWSWYDTYCRYVHKLDITVVSTNVQRQHFIWPTELPKV